MARKGRIKSNPSPPPRHPWQPRGRISQPRSLALGFLLAQRSTPTHPALPSCRPRLSVRKKIYVASIFGGVGDGKKEMLRKKTHVVRKKTHVVRKKTHVVRKFFYVASIFGGAAGRKNMSPWELSSTAWEVSSTAWDFSSTASRRRQRFQCVDRAPSFLGALIQVYRTPIVKIFHLQLTSKTQMRRMEQARQAAALRRRQKLTVAAAPRKMRVNNRHRQGRGREYGGAARVLP